MFAPVGARPGAIKVPPGPIPPGLMPPEVAAPGATVARPPGACAGAADDIAIATTATMQDMVLSMGLTFCLAPQFSHAPAAVRAPLNWRSETSTLFEARGPVNTRRRRARRTRLADLDMMILQPRTLGPGAPRSRRSTSWRRGSQWPFRSPGRSPAGTPRG